MGYNNSNMDNQQYLQNGNQYQYESRPKSRMNQATYATPVRNNNINYIAEYGVYPQNSNNNSN